LPIASGLFICTLVVYGLILSSLIGDFVRSISLTSAVLISINIIIGAGLFINPAPLTQIAEGLGFLAYLLSAVVLLPLLLCIAELATLKPSAGGLYIYAHTYISPMAGFISGWSYFLGKTTSASILAFTFCSFLRAVIPAFGPFSAKAMTMVVLFSLVLLNIIGVKIGGRIQWLFIALKAIPIGFVLFTGIFFAFDLPKTSSLHVLMELSTSVPIAIFALCGFEAICSIAHLIEHPHKNVRRAIMLSFLLVAIVSAIFQFSMYQVLGPDLANMKSPLMAYANALMPNSALASRLLNALVFSSVLGASFGMLTSNCWNLHTIATHNHFPYAKILAKLSNKQLPWVSLLMEAFLGSLILIIQSEQIPLQNMAVFGMTVAYLMSTIAALKLTHKREIVSLPRFVPYLALLSCMFILYLCTIRILSSGASYVFLIILALGMVVAYLRANLVTK
jgi:amino acid transporter